MTGPRYEIRDYTAAARPCAYGGVYVGGGEGCSSSVATHEALFHRLHRTGGRTLMETRAFCRTHATAWASHHGTALESEPTAIEAVQAALAASAAVLAAMWWQAWDMLWAAIDATHESEETMKVACGLADRLEAAANGATCSFCGTVAGPEKLAAFRAHVLTCPGHPAHQAAAERDALKAQLAAAWDALGISIAALGEGTRPLAEVIAIRVGDLMDERDALQSELDLLRGCTESIKAGQRMARKEANAMADQRDALRAELRRVKEAIARDIQAEYLAHTPKGTELCWLSSAGEVVVTGMPPKEDDKDENERHNCDAMGCGSWDHVLRRLSVAKPGEVERLRAALTSIAGPCEWTSCVVGIENGDEVIASPDEVCEMCAAEGPCVKCIARAALEAGR